MLPFWWGMGLLALALLGDLSPRWRPRVSRLVERLERMQRAAAEWTAGVGENEIVEPGASSEAILERTAVVIQPITSEPLA